MTEMLEGITVLDLASVGPAARASRWLADYGATVVKVGPVPKDTGVQITPPFYAYSAHRRMQRALVDMKSAEGREAFLRMVEQADVLIESFRPDWSRAAGNQLALAFECESPDEVDELYARVVAAGFDGEKEPWDAFWGQRYAQLSDPDGVPVDLFAAL